MSRHRRGPEGDQRLSAADGSLVTGYDALASDGTTACGCWIYSGVHPSADAIERASATREDRTVTAGASRPGSAHPLQPRVGTARRLAMERAEEARLVGPRAQQWTGLDTPDFAGTNRPTIGLRERDRRRRPCLVPRRSSCTRMAWAGSGCQGPQGRPPACALRAARVSARNPSTRSRSIPRPTRRRRRQSLRRLSWRRSISVRAHDLSPDRASHRWRHDATLSHLAELQPTLFCEISPELAEEVGAHHGEGRHDSVAARLDRRARARHTAHAAPAGSRSHRAPGRPAVSLGPSGSRARLRRE